MEEAGREFDMKIACEIFTLEIMKMMEILYQELKEMLLSLTPKNVKNMF